MVRKDVYTDLNGYRDIKACEDYDFLIRAVSKRYKIGNCQMKLLRYRYNSESISRKNQVVQSLISSYLAENYRNGRIVTVYEYKQYICSQEFVAKENAIMKTQKKIARFKSSQGIVNRIVSGLILILDFRYIKTRVGRFLCK